MRCLAFIFAVMAVSHGAKLDRLAIHQETHDFELATGEESKIANARINEFFEILARSESGPQDMPRMTDIPTDVAFSCEGRLPGYYADVAYDCQLYHTCDIQGRSSYLCPNSTIFNQEIFTCDWWFNVDCSAAPNFYYLNEEIYKEPEEEIVEASSDLETADGSRSFSFGKSRHTDPFAAIFQGLSVPDETPESSAKVESLLAAPRQGSFVIPVPSPAARSADSISDYLPPTQEYLPPPNDYLPPSNDYLPPSKDYLPPSN